MKTKILVLMLVAVALVAPAARASDDNWILLHVTAGPEGFDGVLYMEVDGVGDGTKPFVSGTVTRADGATRGGASNRQGSGSSFDVRVAGVGYHEVLSDGQGRGCTSQQWRTFDLEPNATLSTVFFSTGCVFTSTPTVSVAAYAGSLTVETTLGGGATAVPFDDVEGGAGVVQGTSGAGALVHPATFAAGVVGVQLGDCEACVGTWTSPDGRSGQWATTGSTTESSSTHVTTGVQAFAGPPGLWSWSFVGGTTAQGPTLHTGEPVLVAYAPIGDAWHLFA